MASTERLSSQSYCATPTTFSRTREQNGESGSYCFVGKKVKGPQKVFPGGVSIGIGAFDLIGVRIEQQVDPPAGSTPGTKKRVIIEFWNGYSQHAAKIEETLIPPPPTKVPASPNGVEFYYADNKTVQNDSTFTNLLGEITPVEKEAIDVIRKVLADVRKEAGDNPDTETQQDLAELEAALRFAEQNARYGLLKDAE